MNLNFGASASSSCVSKLTLDLNEPSLIFDFLVINDYIIYSVVCCCQKPLQNYTKSHTYAIGVASILRKVENLPPIFYVLSIWLPHSRGVTPVSRTILGARALYLVIRARFRGISFLDTKPIQSNWSLPCLKMF